ncbi:MAG: hypothetical protein QNK04_28430 [Myxococcota bacterium]|nr:hypothetical protein [Myxococcota bacterium]
MRSGQTTTARNGVLGTLWLALACLTLASGCARVTALIPTIRPPGALEGRILADPGIGAGPWAVVYLGEPDGPRAAPGAPAARLSRQVDGFSPPLLAVAPGQPVELVSTDGIHHRFFSYSEPNPFDLGLLRSGETARTSFDHPGMVHVYCSLHPGEQATIFVAPSPWFAAVRAPGPYAIRDVPPGSYALHIWSEERATARREVTIRSGESTSLEIGLGRPEPQP